MRPAGRSIPSSTNTNDFTKRKNWDQRIIEELTDFLHVLSPVGKFLFASPSSAELVGYTPDELLGRSITDFLHTDDIDMFIREFNLSIHTRSEFKLYYRFRKKDDKFITFEVVGHPYFGGAGSSEVPKCFFGVAQPYPTKAGTMLDSFLELKTENEKLRKQLQLLQASMDLDHNPVDLISTIEFSTIDSSSNVPGHSLNQNTSSSDTSLATTNLSSSSTSPKVLHKPYDGRVTIPTGASSLDNDTTSKHRKKVKAGDEYVCHECGCVESPEWRRGPNGPKTLCNACGLR
ncbi:PAS domain-containing protein [Umbelopsis sp. PMI_123]|nr:PAS domain-containing protein [Umbelopsis sp. PMI_123]